MGRNGKLLTALAACSLTAAVQVPLSTATARPAGATAVTNVVVQGGTTPVDSGLLQAVLIPGFKKAYPQYNLQYVAVGTGQAITNAENGEGDVVFTHSPTLESQFVTGGWSYEPGGRLVMSSDFVTLGSNSDPAGVLSGPANNVVVAFQEIAAAGAAGTADFVSRGDASGTNAKELSIWKLALPAGQLNSLGEPGTPGTTTDAPWYHKTGLGQGQNIQVTDQCPFSSGACYTIADRGTFAALQNSGSIPDLEVVSQENSAAGAPGGAALLLNPYHVYIVNPLKEPGVAVNLPGAIAFVNYLTSPKTQAAIGAYPSAANPAFVPDAYPRVTVTQPVPTSALATSTVTVAGTVTPNYHLDPSLGGCAVLLQQSNGTQSVTIAHTTVATDGSSSFSLSFTPSRTAAYNVFVPQCADGLVPPSNTGYRQAVTKSAGQMTVKAVVTLAPVTVSGLQATVSGTAAPVNQRNNASVQIQCFRKGVGPWTNIGSPIAMPSGQATYSGSASVPAAGKYSIRVKYTDKGYVQAEYSPSSSAQSYSSS
jgi:tungstate transport system substrate-binding protein